MVIFPLQRIRVQKVAVSVMLQDFFFCLRVFIVLEFDLTMLQDSRINTVDYVLNFFISWFYAAG